MQKVWAEMEYVIFPLSLVLIAFLSGILLNRIVFRRLHNRLAEKPGTLLQMFVDSLHGIPVLWTTIVGIYGAIHNVPMSSYLLMNLERALLVLSLLSVTIVAARTVVAIVSIYAQKAVGVFPSTSLFVNLAEVATYVVGVLIILQSIGISITPVLTALGVGGIAVALALQDTLANLFSGLYILLARQIKLNDYIKLSSGEEGYVQDIAWRNTTIKMMSNNIIIVPNAKISSAIITNHSLPDNSISISLSLGVSYDCDLDLVEKVTVEEAVKLMKEHGAGVPEAEPSVRFKAFADSNIELNVNIEAKEFAGQYVLRHELIKRLHRRYRQEGIIMAYPSRMVYLQPEEEAKKQS